MLNSCHGKSLFIMYLFSFKGYIRIRHLFVYPGNTALNHLSRLNVPSRTKVSFVIILVKLVDRVLGDLLHSLVQRSFNGNAMKLDGVGPVDNSPPSTSYTTLSKFFKDIFFFIIKKCFKQIF